ncbi:MAG: hypothetical protein QM756_42835 [Polyangiaceae bacterium]
MLLVAAGTPSCADDDVKSSSSSGGATATGGAATHEGGSAEAGAGAAPGSDGGAASHVASKFTVEVLPIDPKGDADPASLWWSDAGEYLLVADNRSNRIWKWEPGGDFTLYATTSGLPADPQATATTASRDSVGQLVELADGTVVVVRFGFGTHSSVLWVDPTSGAQGMLPGLEPTRRRISLLYTTDGSLFGGYFAFGAENQRIGAITRLAWEPGAAAGGAAGEGGAGGAASTSAESDFATQFLKPVGLLEMGDSLLAVDQDRNVIYKLPKAADAPLTEPYEVYASVQAPDQLAHGPDGSVFTGQFRPATQSGTLAIRQVFPDGGVAVLEDGLTKPSGLAYDAHGKRLFVADSNGTSVRTVRVYTLE